MTEAAKRPPDRPPVPRAKRSIVLTTIAVAFSLFCVGGYAALAMTQKELGTEDRDEIPASVRASPGGYRSYSFWHSGYHGGK